jgi:tetratricopeptide (TPR) repeat protein
VKAESTNSWTLRIRQNISEVTSDWLFWLLFLGQINIVVFIDLLFILPVALLIAFSVTLVVRNQTSFLGSRYGGRYKSEKEGLREYNANFFKDKALVCEREERYDDAIKYLQAAIKEEKGIENILEIRYKIARFYHTKLKQPQKAINAYKIVSNIAPKGHPIRKDAYEGIKELSQ